MRVVLVGARAGNILIVVDFEIICILLADPVVDGDVLEVVNLLILRSRLNFERGDASLVLDESLAEVFLLFLKVIDLSLIHI